MTFANPLALLWGLLAVPVVILYLRRVRLRREPVATGMFWQRVVAEQRARSAWQRWRHPASLAIQLTLLGLMVVALADPRIPGPRRIVLIVDNSASMNAADVEPTRLAEAKRAAARLISGLRGCDQMAILSAGGSVGVYCTLTNRHSALHNALEAVPSTRQSTQVLQAVELARGMLAGEPHGQIVLLTDGCFDGAVELAGAEGVETVRVGKRSGNVALTRLAARRSLADPVLCEVLVEVRNFSDRSAECTLRIGTLRGGTVATVPITLARDARRQDVFRIIAPEADRVTAQVDYQDPLGEDDGAFVSIASPADGGTSVVWPVVSAARPESCVAEATGRSEGDLRAPGEAGAAAAAARRPGTSVEPGPSPSDGKPPWVLLVGLGVLLLTLEWCFYQRRWVC